MMLRRPGFLGALFFGFLASCLALQGLAQQGGASTDIFTISVASPTAIKDIQVRYFLTDDSGGHWFSTTAQDAGDKIVIKTTGAGGKTARTLKAIAYAPGCQFVTISVDDLTASSRQGEFQCQSLPKIQFRGRTALAGFEQKNLQIEALYGCVWAPRFFGIAHGAISPFSLLKASVEADGSFTVDLPDFAGDPLWSSFSSDATLMFFLVDPSTGNRLAALQSPDDLSGKGFLKVAPSYPEVEFTLQPQAAGKSFKSSE